MLVGTRLFDRIQVFPLDILDQRDRHDLALIEVANDRRNFMQFCPLGSPPAAFARDDLIGIGVIRMGPDQQRLQDSLLADGVDQPVNGCLVKAFARLTWIWTAGSL